MVRQGFKAKVQEMLPGHRLTARTADDGSPVVEDVEAAAYTVPTDAPEGDGTLSWDSTTLVAVRARCGATTGLGYTYGSPTPAQVVAKQLADVPVTEWLTRDGVQAANCVRRDTMVRLS